MARNLYQEPSLVPGGRTTEMRVAHRQRKKTTMPTSDSNVTHIDVVHFRKTDSDCLHTCSKVLDETRNKCAEVYFYYGPSLLQLSRLEAGGHRHQGRGGSPITVPPARRQKPSCGGRCQVPGKAVAQYLHLHGTD